MPAHSRPKDGVASLAYVARIHASLHSESKTWMAGPSPRRSGFGRAGGTSPAMTA
jgi:hypothetical protein